MKICWSFRKFQEPPTDHRRLWQAAGWFAMALFDSTWKSQQSERWSSRKEKDEKSTRWHKHCVVALKKLRCCPQKANTAQEPPLGSFGLVAHLGGTLVRCEDWDDTPRRPQNGRCSCAKLRKQVDSGGPTLCSNFQTDMSLLPEFFRVNLAGIWVLKVSPHWFIDKRETGRCEVARTN